MRHVRGIESMHWVLDVNFREDDSRTRERTLEPRQYPSLSGRIEGHRFGTDGKPGRKPKPMVEGYISLPNKSKAACEPDLLLALETVKDLIGQFGADKLKRMVDLMG